MRITDKLRAQNDVVLQQLRHLDQMIDDGASGDVLGGVVATIAAAEEDHAAVDEPLLVAALSRVLGRGYPVLREMAQDHRHLRRVMAQIGSEGCDALQARVFVEVLRSHLEREERDLLPLVERWVAEATLSAMADECVPVGCGH